MGIMVCHVSQITVYKALLGTDAFWISYIKWYKFYSNNSLAVLGSQKVETLKLGNPKHKDWGSVQLLILCLNFLGYFAECQVIFQWKQTKEKLGHALDA